MPETNYALLSHMLNQSTPTYGNRDQFIIEEKSQIKVGDSANSSQWILSINHIGSHVDMPRHFFDQGKSISDYQPDDWIFNEIRLMDIPCSSARLIKPQDFPGEPGSETQLLLIRTGYEKYRGSNKYWNDNPGLSPEVGKWLRFNFPKIRAVGFDFISLTSWKHRETGREAHRAFLDPGGIGSPLWLLEDLSLGKIDKNIKKVIVSPLFVENSNGSPVTVFAEIF
jgi:arylformamidase